MHQSSSLTFFFRYYFPIFFIGIFAISLIFGEFNIDEMAFVLMTLIISLGIFYYLVFGRLRKVNARSDKIITETLNYTEEIEYEQINYISQTALSTPTLININYQEQETGQNKTFWVLGSMSDMAFRIDPLRLEELELTKYIRGKIKDSKPNYDEANEPSRYLIPLILIVVVLVIFIVGFIIENLIL